MPDPIPLSPRPTDSELAATIRSRVSDALAPVLAELTEAKKQGFDVQFSIGTDGFGRSQCQVLKILKEF